MISKIQGTTNNLSFKDNSNVVNSELIEYKKNFLKDQSEREYQKDLKNFNGNNALCAVFGLGWAAYDGLKGDKAGAVGLLIATAVLYPVMLLFRPKKEKYDEKLQEELGSLK